MTQQLFKDPWVVTQEADCTGWIHYEFADEPRIKMQYATHDTDDGSGPAKMFLTWGYTGLCATREYEPFVIGEITDERMGAFKHADDDVMMAMLLECATVMARGYLRQWNHGKPRDVVSKKTLTYKCAWLMHELSSGILEKPYSERPYKLTADLKDVMSLTDTINDRIYYVAYTGSFDDGLVLLDAVGNPIKRLKIEIPGDVDAAVHTFLARLGINAYGTQFRKDANNETIS